MARRRGFEELIQSVFAIIFFIIFMVALLPLITSLNFSFGVSPFLIWLTVVMVILAFFIKILEEFRLI